MKNAYNLSAFFIVLMVISVSCGSNTGNDDDTSDESVASCANMDAPDGAWIDRETCLMWQKGFGTPVLNSQFELARQYCENLVLSDFTDWRLPSISELRTLIQGCDATEPGGNCPVTDDCTEAADCENESCKGCTEGEGPTEGCYGPQGFTRPCGWFWSSTPRLISPMSHWYWSVNFESGGVLNSNWESSGEDEEGGDHLFARCVRGV